MEGIRQTSSLCRLGHTALSFIRLVLTGIAHIPLIHKFSPSSRTFSQPSHNQLVSFHFSTRTSFRCNIIMLLQTCVNCSCSSKSFDLKPEGHDLDHPCLVSFVCEVNLLTMQDSLSGWSRDEGDTLERSLGEYFLVTSRNFQSVLGRIQSALKTCKGTTTPFRP